MCTFIGRKIIENESTKQKCLLDFKLITSANPSVEKFLVSSLNLILVFVYVNKCGRFRQNSVKTFIKKIHLKLFLKSLGIWVGLTVSFTQSMQLKRCVFVIRVPLSSSRVSRVFFAEQLQLQIRNSCKRK